MRYRKAGGGSGVLEIMDGMALVMTARTKDLVKAPC